jgi:hypothetical protein
MFGAKIAIWLVLGIGIMVGSAYYLSHGITTPVILGKCLSSRTAQRSPGGMGEHQKDRAKKLKRVDDGGWTDKDPTNRPKGESL